MKSLKIIIKSILTTIVLFLTLTLIITFFNYFNIINYKIINIFKIIIPIISMYVGAYIVGRKSEKKTRFDGIKISIIISLLFLSITLLLNKFKIEYIIYLIILIISGISGSIIGIKKKNHK